MKVLAASQNLPALEDNRFLRFFAFASLYAAQGLPWGLFTTAFPAWFAAQGVPAAEIGTFIAIAALPWSFKLVVGPLMDRFTYLDMGRRRPWVIGAQVGILAGTCVLAFAPGPDTNLMLLAGIGFFINSFCALQDVAVDGMAIDVLPENERARANAFMYGGQVAGISAASAGGTWLLSSLGLAAAALLIGFSVFVIMLVPLLFRERGGEKLLPWTDGRASPAAMSHQAQSFGTIFGELIRALLLPMSILLVACEFLNRASAGLYGAISPVVTVQQLGWADTDYAGWQASAGLLAAVFGIVVSPWIDRRGAGIALIVATGIKFAMFAAVALFTGLWQYDLFFSGFIVLFNLTSQVITVAIIALFMNICARKVAATQFAVYMASANLALAAGSAMVAPLDAWLDYPGMYYIAAGMNALFLLLWPLFSLERHKARLAILEGA
jgi:PAT family beta-lactamase induction signal transducer AmpG